MCYCCFLFLSMKEIILVIACEFQTMGKVKTNKQKTNTKRRNNKTNLWIVLDFWWWVSKAWGLDWL